MISQRLVLTGNKKIEASKKNQVGAVLVTSLVLLLVMTLIGITGMRVSSLEEKMASNMRSRNLAFQSAESALREAEGSLAIQPECSASGTNGCYISTSGAAVLSNLLNKTTWGSANKKTYSGGTLANVPDSPEYIIQEIQVDDGSSLDAFGSSSFRIFYRVTGRGTGGTDTAVAIVQSVYKPS